MALLLLGMIGISGMLVLTFHWQEFRVKIFSGRIMDETTQYALDRVHYLAHNGGGYFSESELQAISEVLKAKAREG